MEFWIDIETSDGNKLGSGPITTATNWEHTPRLDAAGTFSFTMPASDPKAALLQHKRVVRCRAIVNGTVTDLGAGVIDEISVNVGDPTMLDVSGPDIMQELATRTVGRLAICEQAWVDLNDPARSMVGWYRNSVQDGQTVANEDILIPEAHDGNLGTYAEIYLRSERVGYPEACTWLYVGHDARFDAVAMHISKGNTNDNTPLRLQYYNGEDWVALSHTDGTAVDGRTWAQSGNITFNRPADWARYTAAYGGGDWFWVRMTVVRVPPSDPSGTSYVKLNEVRVYADVPTTDGINQIMAHAPSTWTRSGYPATASEKYIEYDGESVLQALIMLTEQGGQSGGAPAREHFRLGAGRAVDWLGTSAPSSGLRAVRAGNAIAAEGAGELCLIESLQERRDASEAVTRIYPWSQDGINLALTTRSAPTGYTFSRGGNYLQHNAGAGALGLIEAWVRFTDVSMQQSDSYTEHPVMTSNALFDRALEYLRTHGEAQRFYDLSVVQFPKLLRPGETIDVVYHDYVDGYHAVDIDTVALGTPLHILAPTIRITPEGVGTIALEVATIDRPAQSDASVLANTVRDVQRMSGTVSNVTTQIISGDVGGDADTVDGFHASAIPTPNTLLALNANAQWPLSTIPDGYDHTKLSNVLPDQHHNPVSLSASAQYLLSLNDQQIDMPGVAASRVLASPIGSSGTPQFRADVGLNSLTLGTKLTTPLIDSAAALMLSPTTRTQTDKAIGSDDYISRLTGWQITPYGAADFRFGYFDELHAQSFIADLEQALAGGQIICKSVAPLAADFIAPAPGASGDLYVHEFPGFGGFRVFVDGDLIRLRQFYRESPGSMTYTEDTTIPANELVYHAGVVSVADGVTLTVEGELVADYGNSLYITDCWGTVAYHSTTDGVQRYTFTRSSGDRAGQAPTGAVIKAESLALDYGISGNGYYEVNAIDGPMAENSPYAQVVTWSDHPADGLSLRTRMGNLRGVFGTADEFGLYAGDGISASSRYLRISNEAVELRNLPLLMLGNSGARVEAHSGGLFGLDNSGAGSFALVTNPVSWQGQALGAGDVMLGGADQYVHWDASEARLTVAGDILIHEQGGIFGRDDGGAGSFALVTGPVTWAGQALGAGDVMIGSATAGQYIHWDASETRLTVAGDILIQDPVIGWNDILNKPAGAARLGTGTPSSTGLWLTGTRLGYWNASVNDWQAVIQSDGVTRFGRNVSGSTAMTWDPITGRLRFFGGGASLPRMELRADGALHIGIHSSDPGVDGYVFLNQDGISFQDGRSAFWGAGTGSANISGWTDPYLGTPQHSHRVSLSVRGRRMRIDGVWCIAIPE